jgi:uncharacterized protein YdaU (DUF1376 family)
MSEVSAWMPMFWGDYLADTMELSTFEHGCYLLLIAHYWRTGAPIENDLVARRVQKISSYQFQKIRPRIAKFFTMDGERWVHKRIEDELAKARKRKENSRAGGLKSAGNKRQVDLPSAVQVDFNPPPSPSPSIDKPTSLREAHSPKKGSRLPADWKPNDDLRSWTKSVGLDADKILPSFRDYWLSLPGQRGLKLDWEATWRNWCRRDAGAKQPLFQSPDLTPEQKAALEAKRFDPVAYERQKRAERGLK